MCSGTWMGRSQGVKTDLVGAVCDTEERENECDGRRGSLEINKRIEA